MLRRFAWVVVAWLAFAFLTLMNPATSQTPIRGFPPGTFQSRAALDAPGGGGGGGSVTVDQKSATSGATVYQASSNSFNKTTIINITGGLTKPALVCALIRADPTNDVTAGVVDGSLTWNGVSMKLLITVTWASAPTNRRSISMFGLRNPASGSQTLTVNATNSAADNFISCISFSNVNQTSDAAAFPNPTGVQSANTLDVTSAAGHIAVGGFFFAGGTILGTTVLNDSSSGAILNTGSDYVISSGTPTTVGTSVSQQAIAGVDVSN